VNLTWSASSDNVGVTGYQIYRDNAQIGTSSSTSYSDTGVQPNSSHSYFVVAFDGAGNLSITSNPALIQAAVSMSSFILVASMIV